MIGTGSILGDAALQVSGTANVSGVVTLAAVETAPSVPPSTVNLKFLFGADCMIMFEAY